MGGVIEAPALAAALTLNKGDFVRVGTRGALYLGYRKAIQEAVSKQLAVWGDARESTDATRRRAMRPLERDLETVLVDLADEFPLLASLVERRAGGQKRLPLGRGGSAEDGPSLLAASITGRAEAPEEPALPSEPVPESTGAEQPAAEAQAEPEPQPEPFPGGALLPEAKGKPRPARYGLNIRFEASADDPELGRLVESTVVVNDAHPAYCRAVASRSEGYHVALAVALALARLAVPPAEEHEFVTAFLSRWGESLKKPAPRVRRRR